MTFEKQDNPVVIVYYKYLFLYYIKLLYIRCYNNNLIENTYRSYLKPRKCVKPEHFS